MMCYVERWVMMRTGDGLDSSLLSYAGAARWLRPSGASASLVKSNVGILAQGPEEKRGFAGTATGFASGRGAGWFIAIDATLSDNRPSLGKGVPLAGIRGEAGLAQVAK